MVSSLHRLKDVDNMGMTCWKSLPTEFAKPLVDGGFFVFSDLSVKIEGEFRLQFSLYEMRK